MALTANEIKDICTCGLPTETSPALHSGLCEVWATHHRLTPSEWTTVVSHSASGTAYQEADGGRIARVMTGKRVYVRPRRDTGRVYQAYQKLVAQAIDEMEAELSRQETQSDRDTWYDMDR